MATEKLHVHQAISEITAALSEHGISKDSFNQEQRFKFRGIEQVLFALSPLLPKHGLLILPRVVSRAVSERLTKSGSKTFNVALEVEYDLVSVKDGSSRTVRLTGEANDGQDKASNKAMSAAYKYMAIQTFCIPVDAASVPDADADDEIVAAPPLRIRDTRFSEKPTSLKAVTEPAQEPAQEPDKQPDVQGANNAGDAKVSKIQAEEITLLLKSSGADVAKFLAHYKVESTLGLYAADFKAIVHVLNEKILRKNKANAKTNDFKGVRA